jgi:hypothetical protein
VTDHQPSISTKQGFTRGVRLTLEQLDGILAMIADGAHESIACRAFGTSHTQFIRRLKKEPGYSDRLDEARREKRRLKQEAGDGWPPF